MYFPNSFQLTSQLLQIVHYCKLESFYTLIDSISTIMTFSVEDPCCELAVSLIGFPRHDTPHLRSHIAGEMLRSFCRRTDKELIVTLISLGGDLGLLFAGVSPAKHNFNISISWSRSASNFSFKIVMYTEHR